MLCSTHSKQRLQYPLYAYDSRPSMIVCGKCQNVSRGPCGMSPGVGCLQGWMALWRPEPQTADLLNPPTHPRQHPPCQSQTNILQTEESVKQGVTQNHPTTGILRCLAFHWPGKGLALHPRKFLKHPPHTERTRGCWIITTIISIVWNMCYSRHTPKHKSQNWSCPQSYWIFITVWWGTFISTHPI